MHIMLRVLWALCCWIFGTILGFGLFLILAGSPAANGQGLPPILFLPLFLIYWGLPIWALVFLPAFFLIKDRGVFWSPFLSVPAGMLAGILVIQMFFGGSFRALTQGDRVELSLAWMPAFMGAFIFLLGSLAKQNYFTRILESRFYQMVMSSDEKNPDDW